MTPNRNDCPYGLDRDCPKLADTKARLERLERNQATLIRLIYYIAGIVSVTLGLDVIV